MVKFYVLFHRLEENFVCRIFGNIFFCFYCHDKYDYDNSHKNVDGMKNHRNGINNYDIMNHYFDYKYTIIMNYK